MTGADRRVVTIIGTVAVVLGLTAVARAVDLRIEPSILGQVREGYLSGETEAPIEFYGDFGLSGLPHGTTFDTYFRLEEDFAQLEGKTQFFSGVMRVPTAPPGFDIQLGRQIVAESPVGIWAADSGQVRVGLGGPFSLTVFGGQPRYWEPTYSSPSLSQDEQIFGGTLRATRFRGGALALGYLQQNRQGRELMQQLTASGTRTFVSLPGLPTFYGTTAFDADRQNLDLVRAGVQSFVGRPTLLANLESAYYKPQDNGRILIRNINRREDPIFQLFSLSEMLQFRGGLRYALTPTASSYADLSYQRYQENPGSYVNGYNWSTGVLVLPGGDGLEMVRIEYYGIDSGGGTVNGGRASYENRVYERILFHAKCDVAYYDKATNQDGTAVASLIGLGYLLSPGLVAEVNFEANRNQLFPEDFRFGFFITYSADYSTPPGITRTYVGNRGRPWPWGPAEFGPASWGAGTARWTPDPNLPAFGWTAADFPAPAAAVPAAAVDQAPSDQASDHGDAEGAP